MGTRFDPELHPPVTSERTALRTGFLKRVLDDLFFIGQSSSLWDDVTL